MGKASKFFKSLLGFRTTDATDTRSSRSEAKQSKRRWSFVKSEREVPIPQRLRNSSKSLDGTSLHHHRRVLTDDEDPNKHAIALAAATAAVVDAAVAAAQAAAEVVRMTSITTGYGVRDELAAVKIQSCFRGYLARRALRALKALVKLQAVMRGHIVRKQTADMMRRLQALLRAQTRARSLRSHFSDSTIKHYGPSTPEKLERFAHDKNGNRSISKGTIGFDGTTGHEYDKIVEIDTGQGRKLFQHDQFNFGNNQSLITSRESTVQPTSSSPCEVSTPIKSEGSRSYVSGYSDHPNYMSNTESSRAKARSLSAPRLRPHIEIPKAIKRDSGHKYGSGVHDKFSRKAYPGSGRLDRLGMPVYDYTAENEYCVGYWN